MHNHVANSGRKALLISFLSIFLLLTLSQLSHAVDDGDWWLQRQIQLQQNREDYARRVYGSARHTYDTVDPITSKTKTITKTVIVEDVPSKSKIGKSLLTRAKAFKGGLAGVLGGAAIVGMIEAVGWVMEDGTWVKYKDKEENPNYKFYYNVGGITQPTALAACQAYTNAYPANFNGPEKIELQINNYFPTVAGEDVGKCLQYSSVQNRDLKWSIYTVNNPDYDPNKLPEKERIVITPDDVGGIAIGDYKDPVDSTKDISDKKYKAPVIDAYQHDPVGIGDDLANEMDDKIKNAPPTPDGKPAPIGDSRYAQAPEEDQRTNDRSWEDDKANQANGDTTPNTDPTTGEPTGGQSISLQFPIFCEWAHTMCKWYDDWKASDKVYKDHMTKTEEHQTQEKGFWQSVKDWFDWTTQNDDLENDQPEPINELPMPQLNTGTFQATAGCPEPIPINITIGTQATASISYEPICQFASKWSFVAPLIGFLSGAMILVGVGRKGEDSEI